MTHLIDNKDFFNFVLPVVREVGAYQVSKMETGFSIEYKTVINLLTEVDKKSEDMIVSAIRSQFPTHDILAEEGSGERKDSPYKWVIDPLDGTTNYAHGYPFFSISIGLEYQGKVLGGVVYDPVHREMFTGFVGKGAFLNDKPIRVSGTDKLERALMGTGFAYNLRETPDNNFDHFQDVTLKAQAVRRDGTASLDICYVACGRFDGFWELNLFPWDTAAACVIAQEAGAKVSRFNGAPFTIYEKDILLTNTQIHDEVSTVLMQAGKKTIF